MNLKKIIPSVIAIVLIVGSLIVYKFYGKIYSSNVKEDIAVYIPTDASFDEVKEVIKPVVNNMDSFIWVANQKNYPNVIKAGKYVIEKGMSNNALIDLLRSGKQTPLTLTFNNQDTLEKLAGRIASQIEPDSIQILNTLSDSEFLSKNKLTKAKVLGIFIPNSYEFYWNTSAKSFRDRMLKEYNRFWNDDRISKAKKLNMTKNNVMTLASIVQKETSKVSERPTVAGLYLNRLRDGWPLQADPTVIFALKQKHGQDYEVKRVLNDDLLIDSPYNTYKNASLPPAPIAMPDISSIDAVLNAEKHEYYYMCANVTDIGAHAFARTQAQHLRNARKYHDWLNKQGINR
ncbi:endolytic transglycosylase MltG [Aureibaculum conchae]|uniref:endolytic transglycosylase MltG n=1 Tax=Aureibaculum sp. 2308TA14-22 TaxID=3108392 RepID=UPI003396F16B